MRQRGKYVWVAMAFSLLGCSGESDVMGANDGWTVQYNDDDNQPVCQLKLTNGGRVFGVAYMSKKFSMFFHRDTWNVEDHDIILRLYLETMVKFDGSPIEPFEVNSQVVDNVIVAPLAGINRILIRPFFAGLESHLIIDFPGTEENWEIYYGPARALSDVFDDCVARVDTQTDTKGGQPM